VANAGKGGGRLVLPWLMTVAGFLMTAGVVFWEAYKLLQDVSTDFSINWPVFALGMILFIGGVSSFMCQPAASTHGPVKK